ncbi:MAG TPA: tetratricopeptide repeat protein [Rhizomicrobium sp.]
MRKILPIYLAIAAGLSGCAGQGAAPQAEPQQTSQAESFGDYLAARLAASDHNVADAARLYNASLATDPGNADILSHAFLYTAASGDVAKAGELAAELVKKDPNNRAAQLTLAVAAIKKGDFSTARASITTKDKAPFTGLTMVLIDAWAAAGTGDIKSAEADLAQVVSQGGTQTLADFHKGLIEDLAGNDAAAEAAYKSAVSAGGASPRIAEAYGRFLERSNKLDEARAYYTKMQSDAAAGPVAMQGLARISAGHKPDRLISTPAAGAAEALFGIAASLTDEHSADVAVLYLRLALYLHPDLELAKIVLADRFEAVGKYEDAIAVYDGLAKDSPYRPAAEVQVALDQTRLGHGDQAIAQLKSLTQSDPKDLTAWTALGDAYRDQEKYTEAADAYDHAVALLGTVTNTAWPLYYARAIAEERSHHWDAAESDLKHALQLSPEQAQVLNYLGYSWVDQGKHLPEALAMLEKARSLSPFDGYIVDSVGWAYYRLGRYGDAVKTLENAIQLVPGDATVNAHLGDAYWKVGRKLDAQFQWSHALAFGPDPSQKVELEKKLASATESR